MGASPIAAFKSGVALSRMPGNLNKTEKLQESHTCRTISVADVPELNRVLKYSERAANTARCARTRSPSSKTKLTSLNRLHEGSTGNEMEIKVEIKILDIEKFTWQDS